MAGNPVLYWLTTRTRDDTKRRNDGLRWEIERGECSKDVLHQYEALFDIDAWYEECKHLTFPSVFVQISQPEAIALLGFYSGQNHLHEDVKLLLPRFQFLAPPDQILTDLTTRVNQAMDSISQRGVPNPGFFVRLSARSPKDSAYGTTRMQHLLARELLLGSPSEEPAIVSPTWRQNGEFAAFFRAQIASLCVADGGAAIDLLTKSERIYEDLKLALTEASHLGRWDQKLAIRRWCDHLDIAGEFRCFVFRKQLTAISQYFHFICFPDLLRFRAEIEAAIREFFETDVLPILKWDDCIMDVLVCFPKTMSARTPGNTAGSLDRTELKVQIIEFNPFTRFTSGCLFSWFDPLDSAIIHAQQPFEFRLLEAPFDTAQDRDSIEQDFFTLRSRIDPSLQRECAALLTLVQEHIQDDVSRINSNLRYLVRQNQLGMAMVALRNKRKT
ncbi:MAG: hypothetical protein Q8P67_08700 [archaeon]|nr:hypothetical protein [archaeon]